MYVTWSKTWKRLLRGTRSICGFTLLSNKPPAFADVGRGALRLLLSGPVSSAGRPMSDGERPGPGGWNRIHLIVDDLPAVVGQLRANGVKFRNDIVTGPDGSRP